MRTRIDYDGKPLPDRARACADDMASELPEPETCGTCAHIERCLAIGYTASRERTSCDFYPVRFVPAAIPRTTGDAAPVIAAARRLLYQSGVSKWVSVERGALQEALQDYDAGASDAAKEEDRNGR